MKKILMTLIIILLLVVVIITMTNQLDIGGLSILGIKEIKNRDAELNSTIQEATRIASSDYETKIAELNNEIRKFETQKDKYEEMTLVSTASEVAAATQTSEYKIEYLWVKIGNHAKSEGVVIKLEVARSSSGSQELYDLNFTVTGLYINIADFIRDIEEDSRLGFKIEDFAMVNSSDNQGSQNNEDSSIVQQATFVCKDLKIEGLLEGNTTTNNSTTNTTQITNSSATTTNTTR